jgi:hypothetical protein
LSPCGPDSRREVFLEDDVEREDVAGDFERRDLSVSMEAASVYVIATTGPVTILLAVVYSALWGFGRLGEVLSGTGLVLSLVVLVVGIVAHEALHGLSWAVFGRKPLNSVKFGFQARSLTPYAHLKEPVRARAYRLGTAMPGVVLGLGPSLAGLITGNAPAMLFGLLFTLAAGGDALILWLIRNVDPATLVEDHPTRAGCYVLERPA